jgi:stage V sporulation protein B
MNVIYPGSNAEGPTLLAILGIASFFVCLTMITNAMLQAYGHERLPVYTMPIGGLVKIVLNWVLIANPAIGVKGAAISSLACYFVISAINFVFICVKIPEKPNFIRIFLKPVAASVLMGGIAYAGYKLIIMLMSSLGMNPGAKLVMLLAMAGAIIIACAAYAIMIILFKAISKEELEMVPKGDKIGKFLRIK